MEVLLLAVNTLAGAVILLTVPVAGVSLVVRFRRARGPERQQFRGQSASLAVVDRTMQPTQVSLWLRPSVSADKWGTRS